MFPVVNLIQSFFSHELALRWRQRGGGNIEFSLNEFNIDVGSNKNNSRRKHSMELIDRAITSFTLYTGTIMQLENKIFNFLKKTVNLNNKMVYQIFFFTQHYKNVWRGRANVPNNINLNK